MNPAEIVTEAEMIARAHIAAITVNDVAERVPHAAAADVHRIHTVIRERLHVRAFAANPAGYNDANQPRG